MLPWLAWGHARSQVDLPLAYGRLWRPASVPATLDARPVTVTRIGTNEMQWRALLEVTPGPHQLAVSATLPTGQYSTNAFSSFTNANTAGDTISNVFDGAGLLTQRVWRSNGQSNRVQNLSWDGKGRLSRLAERDATNSGFNWSAIYDPLGRRLQTTTVVVTNGIAQSSQPSIINQSYDPLVEFLELGLSADGTNAWKLYGPDLSGAYGGMQGVGGLEAVKQDGDLSGPVVADARGNVLGVYDTSKGMTWLASRTTGYGAVPGYRPASFAAGISLSYASGWRGRWADVSGLYCLGARYYDPVAGRFLGADPLGHGGDPSLYGFCGGDPINRFDPDGRYGKNYVLNQVAEGVGLAHGLGDFGTDVLGLAEMANPQSVAMNLLNGRGLTPAADQARGWLQDRFDPIVSAMTSEQGSHYASGWFAGNLLPNLIPFAGLEEGGTQVAGGLMESAVQKFPSLGQDVGAAVSRWVGLDAANRITSAFAQELKGGGSWLMTERQYLAYAKGQPFIGRTDGQFMTSARQMSQVIYDVGTDPVALGERLGVSGWTANTRLIRMDVADPLSFNPRLPNGSMSGANTLFRPGGATVGGLSEIATDPLPASQVWATPLH